MKKSYFIKYGIFISLAISSLHIYAQDSFVTGTVKDAEQKEPLISCSITILNTSLGTTTDEKGEFRIKIPQNIVSPKLAVMYTGYKPDTILLNRSTNNYKVFLKQSLTNSLNEVVVTGFSRETTLKEDPTSIRIVSAKAIEQTTETNIIDNLVKNVPGLNAVKTGPNVSKPFIRGLGYSRVETLYDGVPQEGQQFEDEEVLAVDMYSIEKAEVLLGPTTLQYGPDALAGLVNLIPAIPKNTNRTIQGRLLSEYQSNNGLFGNGLRFNYGIDEWAVAVRGSYRTATNYQNSIDGRVYNTGFHERNASFTVVHNTNNGFTNFNASVYDNSQGIPDGSRDSLTRKFTKAVFEDPDDDVNNRPVVSDDELKSYKLSSIYQHIQHYRIYSKSQYGFKNGGSLYAMVSYQKNIRKEYDFPIHTDLLGVSMTLNSYDYDFRYQSKFHNIETTIGANGLYQTNRAVDATDIPIPNYHLFDIGTFFFAKWKKDKFTISGGLRYDSRHVTGKDFYTREDDMGLTRQVFVPDTIGADLLFPAFVKNFTGWSADLGITYQVSEHISLKGNIARGSGAPHVSEFASNGLDGSAHSYFIGKGDLVPEYNLQEDLGVILSYKDVNATISAFSNSLQDYIYLVQLVDANGEPIELIPGNKTFQYNQSAALLYGIEGTVDIHPRATKGFNILNNFSVINGLNREKENRGKGIQGEYLPTVPALRLLSSFIDELKTKSHFIPVVTLRGEVDINGAQNHYLALNETETATPGYTLFNASVNFTVNYTKQFPLQFQLQMNNILDKAYQSNLSRLKYFENYSESPNGHLGIYSMGRNMCVKLIMPF